jgi:hypothetical protein
MGKRMSIPIDRLAHQMKRATKMIFVTFAKEGIHRYPDAPEGVEFLRHDHRHMFKFKVWIEVFTNERDIEFILFKRWLEALYADGVIQLDARSCETISDELFEQIQAQHPDREIWIEVSEDGENGSFAKYPK